MLVVPEEWIFMVKSMSLTLNMPVGQYSTYLINDSRVKRMLSGDHDKAVYMGLWDRIKDWFRHDKKAVALENLYKVLYPETSDPYSSANGLPGAFCEDDGNKYTASLQAFRQLKDLITDELVRNTFTWSVNLNIGNRLRTTFYFGELAVEQPVIQLNSVEGRPDLRGIDLHGACLRDACLRDADLSNVDLTGADLAGADLNGANLNGANLTCADLTGADLIEASLVRANLTSANMTDADLTVADLTEAILYYSILRFTDMIGSVLYGAYLYGADLYNANLGGANLTRANLSHADLTGADLRRADLSWAILIYSDQLGMNLEEAWLEGATGILKSPRIYMMSGDLTHWENLIAEMQS